MKGFNSRAIAFALIACCLALAPLAACKDPNTGQTMTPAQISAEVVSDVALIASGLGNALPALVSSGAIPAKTLGTMTDVVTKIQQVASQIQPGITTAQAQDKIHQIETLLNTAVSAAAGLNLPAPFGPALQAASILLPVVEVGVGIIANRVQHPAPQASSMTPNAARLILRGEAMAR